MILLRLFLTDQDKKTFPFLTIIACLAIYNFFFNISLRRQLNYFLWQVSLKKALLFVKIAFLRPQRYVQYTRKADRKNLASNSVEHSCSAN
ncbi:MAG: hypothetical protein D3917_08430 [Candidatus Electrothrix sp. AX5]|nr:hypothetical protein [Candidatus Electrothrix sp. AX5]